MLTSRLRGRRRQSAGTGSSQRRCAAHTRSLSTIKSQYASKSLACYWQRNVVKRGVCYRKVCPSVRQSCVTPKRFNVSNCTSHHTIGMFLVSLDKISPFPFEFRGSPPNQCIKERDPRRRRKLLLTHRKSHKDFPVLPKLMILNDLELRNGRYIALVHRIRYLWANYVTVVEVRPTLSPTEI